jgi:hypothetical protein
VAPELALGLLTGRERAACLAHLEGCGACRAEVSALAVTADDVLLAGPRKAPPDGFEGRVLARLGAAGAFATPPGDSQPARDDPVRPRRRLVAATALALAAAVAAVVGIGAVLGAGFGAGGLGRLTGGDEPTATAVATAEMRTGTGRPVGDATVRGDDPAVVTVQLPGWADLVRLYGDDGGRPYWLAVELDDGSRTMNRIPPGDTAWEVPLRAGATEVAAISVVDAEGRAWCTGRFPA